MPNDKIGIFIKKLSNKIGLTNAQTTKSQIIYIQHQERSTTPESSSYKQNKGTPNITFGPTICVPLKHIKVKPIRHKGGDPGNHYFHWKHTNRTTGASSTYTSSTGTPIVKNMTSSTGTHIVKNITNVTSSMGTSIVKNMTTVTSTGTPIMKNIITVTSTGTPIVKNITTVTSSTGSDIVKNMTTETTLVQVIRKTSVEGFKDHSGKKSTPSNCDINDIKDILPTRGFP